MTFNPRPVALCAVLLSLSGSVWAHAHPIQLTPEANATVAAPTDVQIEFDNKLEEAFSSLSVVDASGKLVSQGKAAVDSGRKLHVKLRPLAPGTYKVNWVAVADDGHRTAGNYAFHVR